VRIVAYVRRSTGRQAMSQAAQLRAIRRECESRGWTVTAVYRDTASGRSRVRRPGLAAAMEACRGGEADGLVVAKLDRLARSVIDFGEIVREAQRRYALLVLDPGIDTSSATGRLVANVLVSVAQWEAEIIGERTKDALALVDDPRRVPEERRVAVLALHERGLSQRAIAAELGWHKEGVARVLRQARAERVAQLAGI
jgi:DNA invertase Pin-like site-specific DNA recombinase